MVAVAQIRVDARDDLDAFARLNLAWIAAFFAVEAADRKVLEQPALILDAGGHVLTLRVGTAVVGCCALLRKGPHQFELAKMAVDPAYQGCGYGGQLLKAALDLAKRKGATQVVLLTSSKLESALHLYRQHGFEVVPQACHPDYARCDVIMQRAL